MNRSPEKSTYQSMESLVRLWKEKMNNAHVDIGPFDSIMESTVPPTNTSGYRNPVYQGIIIDGKKMDIYVTGEEDKWHSVYVHVKE